MERASRRPRCPSPPPGVGSEESEQKVLPLSRRKGCQSGRWDFSRSGSHPLYPGFVSWAGVGVESKISVGFRKGFPFAGEVGVRRPGSAHLPLGLCLQSPSSSPFNFFFSLSLSFNLISSNSTFVVNRRHAGISQSPSRNQLVKKAWPALGKQATDAAPTSSFTPPRPVAGSLEGSLAPRPLRPGCSGAGFA